MNQKNFIKKKRRGILSCAIVLFCLTNLISCKKTEIAESVPIIASNDYLTLKSGEEFNELISLVSSMSDSAYNIWKVQNNLRNTLYDKFLESSNNVGSLNSEDEMKSVIDTNFFYLKNKTVYSKNGILLDKVLNQFGVIQIGGHILRYQNGNIFYVSAEAPNMKSINSKMQLGELSRKFENVPSSTENLPRKNDTYSRAVGVIANPQHGQQYNFELAYQEDQITPIYRYRTWLFENYIIYATGRTDFLGDPIWSTNYRVYFQFSLQQWLGGWINMGAFTNVSFFHIESKTGGAVWGGWSGFVYAPGTIMYSDQSFPVPNNNTPFNHTVSKTVNTALGAFPTLEIYKTNTTVDMPISAPLPGATSVTVHPPLIKVNIEHNRDVLPDKFFYYESQ